MVVRQSTGEFTLKELQIGRYVRALEAVKKTFDKVEIKQYQEAKIP